MIFRQDLEIALAIFQLKYDRQPSSLADLSFLRSLARHEIIQKAKLLISAHTDNREVELPASNSQTQRKEIALLKLELKAAKALLNPDCAAKTDKYAKLAKSKFVKVAEIGDLKELNNDLEFLESCRTLNVYIDQESKKKDPLDSSLDLINSAAESFVCSVVEKLDLKFAKAALFQNYKEYFTLCGQMVN